LQFDSTRLQLLLNHPDAMDDCCLIGSNPFGLTKGFQIKLDNIQAWARRKGVCFNVSKWKLSPTPRELLLPLLPSTNLSRPTTPLHCPQRATWNLGDPTACQQPLEEDPSSVENL